MTDTDRIARNGAALDEEIKQVEAGVAHFARVRTELDDANRHNAELAEMLTRSKVEIEHLRAWINTVESRNATCIAERDLAVGQRAKYESLFSMMLATMREFQVPAVPLIREHEGEAKQ